MSARPRVARSVVEHRPVTLPDFSALYEVTSDGRVWSVRNSRYLTGQRVQRGHVQVRLSNGPIRKMVLVHHLVLAAFVSPQPDGMFGCHNDGDPSNNDVSNLRWDDASGNMQDKRRHGTEHNLRKTHCPHGHPYSGENLGRDARGRQCKTCRRERMRRARAARS